MIWFHGHHSRAHYVQIVIECLPYVRYFSRCQDYTGEQRIVSIDALRNLQPSGDNFEQMMSEMRRAGRFGSIH